MFTQIILQFEELVKPTLPNYNDFKKLYKKKDFTEEAVEKLYSNFEDRMIEEYLENIDEQNSLFPIVLNELENWWKR